MIKEYLQAAFEDGDIDALMEAIGNVAKAKGMSEIARETNLSRKTFAVPFHPEVHQSLKQ